MRCTGRSAGNGEPLFILDVGGIVFSVAYAPDGQAVAAANNQGLVRLFDTANGQTLVSIDTGGDELTSLIYSPDGLLLFASGSGTDLVVIDVQQEAIIQRIENARLRSIALSPDGIYLAGCSWTSLLIYGIE